MILGKFEVHHRVMCMFTDITFANGKGISFEGPIIQQPSGVTADMRECVQVCLRVHMCVHIFAYMYACARAHTCIFAFV